jgi:hypothetical protein
VDAILTGECRPDCGLCCLVQHEGELYTCAHLHLGTKRCQVYALRTHMMPITMFADSGRMLSAHCAADGTPEETLTILPHIGQGCSLTVAG